MPPEKPPVSGATAAEVLTADEELQRDWEVFGLPELYEAPTAGNGATCKSCAHCPWMAMNGLENLAAVLRDATSNVHVPSFVPGPHTDVELAPSRVRVRSWRSGAR